MTGFAEDDCILDFPNGNSTRCGESIGNLFFIFFWWFLKHIQYGTLMLKLVSSIWGK